jgi:hypothetical protein
MSPESEQPARIQVTVTDLDDYYDPDDYYDDYDEMPDYWPEPPDPRDDEPALLERLRWWLSDQRRRVRRWRHRNRGPYSDEPPF